MLKSNLGVICYFVTFIGGLLGVAGIKVGVFMFLIGAGILLVGMFISLFDEYDEVTGKYRSEK